MKLSEYNDHVIAIIQVYNNRLSVYQLRQKRELKKQLHLLHQQFLTEAHDAKNQASPQATWKAIKE